MPPKPAPPLQLVDSEITGIIRYLNLKPPSSKDSLGRATSSSSSDVPSLPFPEVIGILMDGVTEGEFGNSMLEKAVEKVKSFMEGMEKEWRVMSDDSIYEPKFEEIVTKQQLNAVITFIDADGSGTLELDELADAFRISRRFSIDKMLQEGSIIALRSILPPLRERGHTVRDLLKTLNKDRSGYITREVIQTTFEGYSMTSDDIETTIICLDGGDIGKVVYTKIADAFKIASNVLRKREFRESKREREQEKRNKAREEAEANQVVHENAFNRGDLNRVFEFLDYTRDGSVNIEETLAAFGKAKRAKVEAKMMSKGKRLLKKLFEIVKSHGLTMEDWFNSMDTTFQRDALLEETDSENEDEENGQDADRGGPQFRTLQPREAMLLEDEEGEDGEGKQKRRPTWLRKGKILPNGKQDRPKGCLSSNELRIGFKKMASSRRGIKFTQTDLVNLMRYVDPDGDGDLSFDELEYALARIYETSPEEIKRDFIFGILREIDDVARSNGSLLMTVFFNLDADGSGELTRKEFVDGVMELKPSTLTGNGGYHEPTYSSQDDLQAAIDYQELNKRELQHNELVRIEKSGAGRILRVITEWTKERGLTNRMLIEALDKNGDGEVSTKEMIDGIKWFMEPSTRIKAAKKKKAMQAAKKVKEDKERMLAADRLQVQMRHAEACGATKALSAIEKMMRKNCMRVVDMYDKIDKDGDGEVDAGELRKALKKCGLYLSKVDVRGLVKFLDTSLDGFVGCDELEAAIKTFRRFSWQKKEIDELLKNVTDINICERCESMEEVFGVPLGEGHFSEVTGSMVVDGLARMRGDKGSRLWMFRHKDKALEDDASVGSMARTVTGATGTWGAPSKRSPKGAKTTGRVKRKKKKGGGGSSGFLPSISSGGGGTGGGLYGASTSLADIGDNWTPAYVERLYNLNQQAAFKALFRDDDNVGGRGGVGSPSTLYK